MFIFMEKKHTPGKAWEFISIKVNQALHYITNAKACLPLNILYGREKCLFQIFWSYRHYFIVHKKYGHLPSREKSQIKRKILEL